MQQGSLAGKSALDLFPDLFTDPSGAEHAESLAPPPPDKDWLADCLDTGNTTRAANIPAALVAIVADQRRIQAVDTLKRMGYRVDLALGADEGLELLRITHYDLVLCEADRAFADIHRTIRQFPPGRRRLTFYAIVGPRLHTLYDLEALAFSANLVINDREMPHLEPVLRKGLQDYEKLFRPLLDALAAETSALP